MEGTIATIMMFAGNFAPKNWAFCAGQTIAISSNTALFSLLGTTYGGNGTTNFMLPNLQGRVAVGAGQAPGLSDYELGQTGGAALTTMSTAQMPAHGHTASLSVELTSAPATTTQGSSNILATPTADTYATAGTTPLVNYGGLSVQDVSAGGGQPFSVVQPFVGMNYVICQYGIFPSRP
ncbi:MAG TPA: tail fiber protein [Saprospiraceae bacterium]|nr:tail fiber protein [Saprospiraceae bacterium]